MNALVFDSSQPCKDFSDMTEEEKQKLKEDLEDFCKFVDDWFARNLVPRIPRLPNER